MTQTHQDVAPIVDLYERGLYLQAYEEGTSRFGEIKEWRGAAGRCIAGRLCSMLGAPRLSLWHRLKAWRETPDDPEVRYYYGWTHLEYEGPWATWQFLKEQGDMPKAPPDVRASWYSLHVNVLGALRDFDVAETWMTRALEVAANNPWVKVTQAFLLEQQDDYDGAMKAAEESLALQPWYRPGVMSRAHLLTLLGRDDESEQFLREAATKIECAALYLQIARLHYEREDVAAIQECIEQYERFSPLLEGHVADGFHSLRSYLAYCDGDDAEAIRWARLGTDEAMQKVADRLEDPSRKGAKRIILPVKFTRQHEKTCVPATLTALSRYWSMSADHLQVAEEICYNGTTAYAERNWASTNGWVTREFTVTEEATERLLQAGVPFTLTTTAPGSGHLQAVMGIDGRRGSLLIRDPYTPTRIEGFVDKLLEQQAAFGPRGMALVPQAESARLTSIELPDAEWWDRLHAFDGALIAHRRDDAVDLLARLKADAPGHRITLHAQWRLGIYDANSTEQLAAVESLLEMYPKDDVLRLMKLSLLRELSRRDERLRMLDELCEPRDADPSLLVQYAQELREDATDWDRATDLLMRAIRRGPLNPHAYYVLAMLRWDAQRFEDGLELYRFAACLDDKDEQLAQSYFRAAQHCRETETALEWLQQRFERFGQNSSLPARTLDWALVGQERTHEAIKVLEEALLRRPDDGDLKLYAASALGGTAADYRERSVELLNVAKDQTSQTDWLRAAGYLESIAGNAEEVLQLNRELVALQPLAIDAHQNIAQRLHELEGPEAAVAHLRDTVERFPHHQPLLQCYIDWLRETGSDEMESVIRRLLELNPADGWATRELGLSLIEQRRFDEAEQCVTETLRLEPQQGPSHILQGELCFAQGELAAAREAFRRAVRISVDDFYSAGRLLECCDTPEDRIGELEFVRQQLVEQPIYGDGLLAFRVLAHNELNPDELLELLQEALRERPDLWHAWSACVRQLCAMERLDEATELAEQATDRFPLLPRLWLDRSIVERLRGRIGLELKALEAARQINPAWSDILRPLSEVYERRGDFDRAYSILEAAVTREPLDGVNRGWLAEILWKKEERDRALDEVELAIQHSPGNDWLWTNLATWSEEAGCPERLEGAARGLVERRPREARSWVLLARTFDDDHVDESIAAIDRAIEINPRSVEAYSHRAQRLAAAERFDEAFASCRPAIFGDTPPAELTARAADIEWSRGNTDDALEAMRQSLQADPNLYAGWQRLADWYRDLEKNDESLEAAREMVRLEPHSSISLGYYGEALLIAEQRDEAKDVFRRAFELEPAYQFGGIWQFDLQFEDHEYEAAKKTLDKLQQHAPGAYVEARVVQMAAHKRDTKVADEAMAAICTLPTPGDDIWPLQTAAGHMWEANWKGSLQKILSAATQQGNVHPEVGTVWAFAHMDEPSDKIIADLKSMVERGPVGERAVYSWVTSLVADGHTDLYRRFRRDEQDWLMANTYCWGSILYASTLIPRDVRGLVWADCWRGYDDATPWMLDNVVELFRKNNRGEEAVEVSQQALTLTPDHATGRHELWLAVDEMHRGDFAAIRERWTRIAPAILGPDMQPMWVLLDGLLTLESASEGERAAVVANIRQQYIGLETAIRQQHTELGSASSAMVPGSPQRRFCRDCLRAISQRSGLRMKLWCWWKSQSLG